MITTATIDPQATFIRLIKGLPIAMLTSINEDGRLQSRPMIAQTSEFDGALWFMSGKMSQACRDVAHHPWVNVSYSSLEHQRYVSVVGHAELVNERDRVEKVWSPTFATWFPLGISDPDLIFLKITVESAEYWESPSNWVGWALAFTKSFLSGAPVNKGEHRQLDVHSKALES